jgi:hypothetical protein
MTEPLGDKIISWLLYIFAASWGLGWVFLLSIMLIQKVFPNLLVVSGLAHSLV